MEAAQVEGERGRRLHGDDRCLGEMERASERRESRGGIAEAVEEE